MLQSIDKKIKVLFYFILFFLLSTQLNKNIDLEKNFLKKRNIIEIKGLSEKNNDEVYNSLKFLSNENIFFLKKDLFFNILKKNNLVETVYIKKIYPNLIKINIEQAKLLAITTQNGKKFYVGSNERLISLSKIEKLDYTLPFLYGKSNLNNFIKLKNIIDKSDLKFDEIESFYYFPSNRWDIKTKDGFIIKLPEKNILKSIKFANLIKKNEELNKKKIIDLRIGNNIILSNEWKNFWYLFRI